MNTPAAARGGQRTLQPEQQGTPGDPALLSVLTVVRNGQPTLDACIRSVAAQTYQNVEHIIVDGCSTDGTLDILRSHGAGLALWVSEPDSGIYNAMNKGIGWCRGACYMVLGCDDVLLPTAAASLIRHAADGLVVRARVFSDIPRRGAALIRAHSAGCLIHVQAHHRFGWYDESYSIAADTKFLSAAARAGATTDIDDVVGVFAAGGASADYARCVTEHARAMRESGAWGALRSLAWTSPRQLFALVRR